MSKQSFEQSGYLYIDSSDEIILRDSDRRFTFEKNFNEFSIQRDGNQDLLGKSVGGFSVINFGVYLDLGNINIRNSIFQFYSSNTGGIGGDIHTANILTLPGRDGNVVNYLNSSALRADILSAINALTAQSGLTFSFVIKPYNPNLYDLVATGGTFCFALQQSDNTINSNVGVLNGKYVWNPSQLQELRSSHVCGSFIGLYTRYIDCLCGELVEDQEINILDGRNNQSNQVFTRFYLTPEQAYNNVFSYFISLDIERNIKKIQSKSIKKITLILQDEFGKPLILPNIDDATENNSFFNLVLKTF